MQRQSAPTTAQQVPPVRSATLRCLGPASVTVELAAGVPQPVVGLGKPLALLAYLALAPSRSASRERLTDLLWGDQDRPTARHSLRVALHYLRSRIGEWVLDADGRTCTVSADLDIDALSFAAAVDQADFLRALEFYRGDFLSDFASPGCREFEHWAEVERAHLRSRAARAGEAWCRRALDHGVMGEAKHAAARVKEIDPQSELGWRLSLEVLVASGDLVGAAAETVRFQAWLDAEERDAEPASRSAILAAQRIAATDGAEDGHPRSLIAEFTGRERQFATLLDAWKEAAQGKTRIVVVSGGAGLGKSRLLEAVAHRLKSLRRRVLTVRAYHGERSNPYAFASALAYELAQLRGAAGMRGSLAPHLVALDSRLSEQFRVSPAGIDGAGAITQRATAIRELLSAVCDEGPLALLLDDAHWFDDASRQVLAGALARLASAPLLVVITTRTSDAGLALDDEATHLPLAPLTRAEVEALISSLGALPTDEPWAEFSVTRVTAASRGVPLLVLSALEQLLADGTLELRDGHWHARESSRVRERLRRIDALGARLRALPETGFTLLLACAIAGVPLPCRIADALAPSDSQDRSGTAEELERLGYLRKSGDCVEVAHDAFAETALEIADDDTRNRVGVALGERLIAESDEQWVERGIRMLIVAGNAERAHAALRGLVRRNLRRFQRGPSSEVARILGLPITDSRVKAAVRSLPLGTRVGARGPAIAAAAVLVMGFAATLAAKRVNATLPDAVLEITVRQDRLHARTALIPIRAQTWAATSLRSEWQRTRVDTTLRARYGSLVMPGEDEWADEWQAPDSGGVDVALFDRHGLVRRLTSARADEVPGSWSPDGKRLAIETSQFGLDGHRVIAELDLSNGAIRPLTTGSGFDGSPRWSPDGTRIAFERDPRDGSGQLVCVILVAGGVPSCARLSLAPVSMLGWVGADHVLLRGTEGTVIDLDATTMLPRPRNLRLSNENADLSPDGRWLVYYPWGTPTVGDIRVVSTSDLLSAKDVVATSISGDVSVAWRGTAAVRSYLDTLRFDSAPDSLPIDTPSLVKVVGISNQGIMLPVRALQWRSLNPEIAAVDTDGVVHPYKQGEATIEASAGGWRLARRRFAVVARRATVLFSETWGQPLETRWQPFGMPLPKVVHDSLIGDAFWNNGDGTYFSGAYLREPAFDARDGLALDATVRTLITRDQWQYLELRFARIADMDGLRRQWDHRSGYLPSQFFGAGACYATYPASEGPAAALAVSPGGELPRPRGSRLPPIALGVPTRIRVQIMPDGRCGVAVDGVPLSLVPALTHLDSIHVVLQGSSVGTRVLVGPITVRQGVPNDIDWSAVRSIR